jgi:acyl-CoA thioester hydrolase
MAKKAPSLRKDYKAFSLLGTRWSDNDIYGHMNNVIHYSLFDTAVNRYLIENGALDILGGAEVFLVVETGCRFFAEMAFPDRVTAGLRVGELGKSSVRYEIGLFRNDDETAAAEGHFIHVNVDRATRKPRAFGDAQRRVIEPLLIDPKAEPEDA